MDKELIDLKKDYEDCLKYLRNIDGYNYDSLCAWTQIKYMSWVDKNKVYALDLTGGVIPAKDGRERAFNALNNLKYTLEKIAAHKGWNMM